MVTFLFTDVVGSTAAWERDPAGMAAALAWHDELVRAAVAGTGGHVFATGGDGYAVAFAQASAAVAAGVAAQRALQAGPWPGPALAVRMGAHTGEAVERDGDYFGPAVNRAARLMGAANGGQLVATEVTAALAGAPPDGVTSQVLGTHRLEGIEQPVDVVEYVIDGRDGLGRLQGATGTLHHLPQPRTSFVGRVDDLARLRSACDEHRLVTVTAPGGSGKTRLVVQAAPALAADHHDGVWFVDLADLRRDEDVLPAVVAALDLGSAGAGHDALATLSDWQALVVLDNCEQVLDGAADAADALLAAGPGVCVLATSREALAVDGEQVVPLGPLTAGGGDEAVGLFLARARLVAPDLRPDDHELDAIAALCDALDRLPLAIELAAARVDRLPVGELAQALLHDRGERRTRRRRGRHRDLRSVLAWSTELLEDDERALWRRLAVFEGGFTGDAAAVVAGHGWPAHVTRDHLDGLVDRSLLVSSRTPFGLRYRLLETMRSVALEELAATGDAEAVRDRHVAWVRAWSAAGHDVPVRSWTRDDSELDNQRAALRRLEDRGDVTAAAVLLGDAASALAIGGHLEEVRAMLQRLRAAPLDERAAARLDVAALTALEWAGELETVHALADGVRARDRDDRSWLVASLLQAHHLAALDATAATALLDEVEERASAFPLVDLLRAEVALGAGRPHDAVAHHLAAWGIERLADLPRPAPNLPVDMTVLSDLGLALLGAGRLEETDHVLAAMADAQAPPALRFYLPMHRALVAARAGALVAGAGHLDEAADLERRWPSPTGVTDLGVAAADLAVAAGEAELALEAVLAARAAGQRTVGFFALRRALTRRLRDELPAGTLDAARARGAGTTPRAAIERIVERLAS